MKEFKYDVLQLIEGVRDRQCLWDKTIENYKDRVERRIAWEQIFNILEPNYEDLRPEEKRITGEQIINKWTNIRDTFVKTLKTKMGRPKKKYVLYNHLQFLTKITPHEEPSVDYNDDSTSHMKEEETEADTSYGTRRRSRRKGFDDLKSNGEDVEYIPKKKHTKQTYEDDSIDDNTDAINCVQIDETSDPRIMNEDEAFFASLLPTVVKYNEDERLEFRIEVLAVMKKIKDKRKWTSDN